MQRRHTPMGSSETATVSAVQELQTCVLKVSIHCGGCRNKVSKLLQRIEGVCTIHIDSEQGKVTVSGTTDPTTLISRLAKNGKHAELIPTQEAACGVNNDTTERDEAVEQRRPQHLDVASGRGKGLKPEHIDGKKMRHQHQRYDGRQIVNKDRRAVALGMSQLRNFILPLITRDQRYVKLGNPGAVHDEDGCGRWSQDDVYCDDLENGGCDARRFKDTNAESLRHLDGIRAGEEGNNGNAPSGGRPQDSLAVAASAIAHEDNGSRYPNFHHGIPLIHMDDDPVCAPAHSLPSTGTTSLAALFQAAGCTDGTLAPVDKMGPVHGLRQGIHSEHAGNTKCPPPIPTMPVNHYPDGRFVCDVRNKETTAMQHPMSPIRSACMPPSPPNYVPCLL